MKVSEFVKTKDIKHGKLELTIRPRLTGDEWDVQDSSVEIANLQKLVMKARSGRDVSNAEIQDGMKIKGSRNTSAILVNCILEWNLEDDAGKPLPITEKNLRLIPSKIMEWAKKEIDELSDLPGVDELKNSVTEPEPLS